MITQLRNTLTKRVLIIAALGFAMLIPLSLIEGTISERGRYYESVINDIAYLWGAEQTLTAPLLIVPFTEKWELEEKVKNDLGEIRTKSRVHRRERHAVFLPKTLKIDAAVAEQYRRRSIYRSLVFEADLNIIAQFEQPDIAKMSKRLEHVHWERATVVVGMSDTKSIDDIQTIAWQGNTLRVTAGSGVTNIVPSGFRANIDSLSADADANKMHTLDLKLSLKGSRGLRFSPLGETTTASIRSSWPHPKFSGNLLPDEHAISADGFSATWQVPHLARNYPQAWVIEDLQPALTELVAGVDLFEPVFIYSKINRAVKYGLLFIGLTFLTFLAFEITAGKALHFVQYGLIGTALAVFYLLLLSLSEHITFGWSYLVASVACIAMITMYAGRALSNRQQAKILFGLLSALFALLYALLRMEDYALLVGTWVLFAAIGVMMYLTRGIGDNPVVPTESQTT